MDDALGVRCLQAVRDIHCKLNCLVDREAAISQDVPERWPLDKLHDEVVRVGNRSDVVQGADVRMVQRGDRLRLAQKSGSRGRWRRHPSAGL